MILDTYLIKNHTVSKTLRSQFKFCKLLLLLGIKFSDSTVSTDQIKLTAYNLEFASTKPKDKNIIKEKANVTASKFTAQTTCGNRMALSFRILGGSESQLGKNMLKSYNHIFSAKPFRYYNKLSTTMII